MTHILFSLFTFVLGIYPVLRYSDVPVVSSSILPVVLKERVAPVMINEINSIVPGETYVQEVAPSNIPIPSPEKIEALNVQSGKTVGTVSRNAVDRSPVLVPCAEIPEGCSSPEMPPILYPTHIIVPTPKVPPTIAVPTRIVYPPRPLPTYIPLPSVWPEPPIDRIDPPIYREDPKLYPTGISDPILPPPVEML